MGTQDILHQTAIKSTVDRDSVIRCRNDTHARTELLRAGMGDVVSLSRRNSQSPTCRIRRSSIGFEWWQVHIRGYHHPDGIELAAHFETEPSEHPNAHIDLFGLDVNRGMGTLMDLLDTEEIEYDCVDDVKVRVQQHPD